MVDIDIDKNKILAGRKIINIYRKNHSERNKDQPSLLKIMVDALEKLGFTSTKMEFEPKKNEIIAKFFADNGKLNLQTFKECYKMEGYCSHKYHGITSKMSKNWGCSESWYQKRMEETKGKTEEIITIDEGYIAWFCNPAPKHLPLACTYKIVKIKECDLDWEWQ